MKNNSPTGHKALKRSGNYGFCLLFVLAVAMSCVTEEEPAPAPLPENPTALVDTRQVKDWFERNEPILNDRAYDQANARKGGADRFMVPFVEKLPDWGRVHSFRFADGRQVYEVALDNTDLLVVPRPVREALGDENIGEKINQSLLFIESPGGYRVLLARYYPASEEDVRGFDGLQYNLLSEGWSGVVDIYSFEEAHVRNFMVSEGLTVLSRTYRPAGSGSSSRGEGCYNIWIDYPTYGIPGGVGSKRPTYVMVCAEYDIPIGSTGGGSGSSYHGFYPPSGGGSGSYGSPPSGGGGPSGAGGEACMDGGTYCFDPPGETEQEQIEKITDPDTRRTAQLNYLRNRGGREFVEMVEEMLTTPGLTMGDVAEINKLVEKVYLQQKGEFMMSIFSPEALSQIFLLYSANISSTLRDRIFRVVPRHPTIGLTQFSSKTIDHAVNLVMKDPRKIEHLFTKKHNFGALVNKLGGQENTVRAVLNAANGKFPANGIFDSISVNVGGYTVVVRGSVVNGIPRIGTMFIPL